MISDRGGLAVVFIIMFIVLSVVFVVMMPMALTFNTAIWVNSEGIADLGLAEAGKIEDPSVRGAVEDIFETNGESFNVMQSMIAFFTMYSWLIIPGIILTVYLLLARQQVETGII